MNKIIIILFLLILTGCDIYFSPNNFNEINNKNNKLKVELDSDTVHVGDSLLVKAYIENTKSGIVDSTGQIFEYEFSLSTVENFRLDWIGKNYVRKLYAIKRGTDTLTVSAYKKYQSCVCASVPDEKRKVIVLVAI